MIQGPTPPIVDAAATEGWLLMVRHTAVDESLNGVCYGSSDVELSPDGTAHVGLIASHLALLAPAVIYHSGQTRARRLAEAVANRLGRRPRCDRRIAEFDFGEWELRRWDEIHGEGHEIARLIQEPETFAPPGGETVLAMRDRVLAWHAELPRQTRILAVSHGGPISALRGALSGAPPHAWPSLVPAHGDCVNIPMND